MRVERRGVENGDDERIGRCEMCVVGSLFSVGVTLSVRA